MTKDQMILKEIIASLRVKADNARANLMIAQNTCVNHHVVRSGTYGAWCDVCGLETGWYCPSSDSHICNYISLDGSVDYDCCVHCGQPEERL